MYYHSIQYCLLTKWYILLSIFIALFINEHINKRTVIWQTLNKDVYVHWKSFPHFPFRKSYAVKKTTTRFRKILGNLLWLRDVLKLYISKFLRIICTWTSQIKKLDSLKMGKTYINFTACVLKFKRKDELNVWNRFA